jgi:hypothetical protein
VDDLNNVVNKLTETPAGAILVMLAVFLARIYLDRWAVKEETKKKKKKGHTHNG